MATRARSGKEPQKKAGSGKAGAGGQGTRTAGKAQSGKTGTRTKAAPGKSAPKKAKLPVSPEVQPMEPPTVEQSVVPIASVPPTETASLPPEVVPAPDQTPVAKEAGPAGVTDTTHESEGALQNALDSTASADIPLAAAPDNASEAEVPCDAASESTSEADTALASASDNASETEEGLSLMDMPPDAKGKTATDAEIALAAVREVTPELAAPSEHPVCGEEASTSEGVVAMPEAPIEAKAEAPVEVVKSEPMPDAENTGLDAPTPSDVPVEENPLTAGDVAQEAASSDAAFGRSREGEAQLVVTYLAGAMEGLAGQAVSPTTIGLDAELADLALEKLQYFGQVLHLLAEAVDFVATKASDQARTETPAALRVRLEQRSTGRLALRCFDDGRFFKRVLPKLRLDMEALRPLVLAVVRAQGSICLRRGRCVEFEITG